MSRQISENYPVSRVCEVLACPRSSYYYEPTVDRQDRSLLEAIERLLMRWPFYGYRRVTAQLQREGHAVGETRVVPEALGRTWARLRRAIRALEADRRPGRRRRGPPA